MAGLEEMMAGLFGSNEAAGLDEMRRRRGGPGGGGPGYEGIGGAMVTPGQMMPFWGGLNTYDYSGAMGAQMGGRQGLMSLLGGRDVQGPALRHFARQGFDFMPPGQDNREKPGGPNIAPGNIDNAQALDQPQGNLTPGVPQGVARGQAPGQVMPRPQTQGWRNVHPGYSATAAYGTDPSGRPLGFTGGPGGRPEGAPAAQSGQAPGGPPGGGRPSPQGGGAGGGGGGNQNPIGGGPGPVRPGAGGGGGTGGGQATGGKQTGGGGAAPQERGGFSGAGQGDTVGFQQGSTTGRPAGVGPGGNFSKDRFRRDARDIRAADPSQAFGNTIHIVPNQGNNNTPSEMRGATRWSDTHERTTDAQRAAREARQQQRAQQAAADQYVQQLQNQAGTTSSGAPSASNFGRRAQGGTAPISGKTKPSSGRPSGFRRGQR